MSISLSGAKCPACGVSDVLDMAAEESVHDEQLVDVVAAYAFDVLSRQMMNGRREYIGGMRSNTKPATKTARGDTFCEYWIIGAYQAITPLTVTEAEETLIAAYRHKLTESQGLTTKDTRPANKCRGADGAANAGYTAGKNAKLNQGVSAEQLKIGGVA